MFKQNRVLSGREARRYMEREKKYAERKEALDAWWNLTPEERKKRMDDIEAFRRINRNGITLDDVKEAEDKAYMRGVKNGIEGAMKTCYAAICLALHENFGFGRERCMRALNAADEKVIITLTSEEAIQEVFDTIGLQINFSNDALPGERIEEV